MINHLAFTCTVEQWDKIKVVVCDRLGRDADQIELTRPAGKLVRMAAEITRTVDNLTTTTSLRSCVETAASLHIEGSAFESQTPGHKASIRQLTKLRDRAEALRDDIINALRPSFPLDNDVRLLRKGSAPISVHSTDQAIETLLSVIDANIAAQRPQQTANTSKTGRDRFWNEMLAIWTDIGGAETGIAAAEFLVATSNSVFDRVRNIGGRKTAISAPYDDDDTLAPVVEWLRLRAKARRATS
jgi:hypothetical protein